ncbi:MAG: glycosyltransferase family 39 protein [Rhodospirillaceae bacterium]|nr:glycosyltransferase family 39 protein [Rhodospirillales bacterium]
MRPSLRPSDFAPPLMLLAAVAILHLTTPPEGQFWWSDAPRHALNGIFLRDLFAALPFDAPQRWAWDYYLQYPALTILFYPPLFPAVEAMFFALFGASSSVAQLTVSAFYAALALGTFSLMRRWLDPWQAAFAAMGLIGMAEVALWGRQIMLEIPAFAALVWAFVLFLRHLDEGKPRHLYASLAILAAGLYLKQTIIFIAPVMLTGLWLARGRRMLADRHVWIAGTLFALALVPLAVLTVKFGQANMGSVAGVADRVVARDSLTGWLFYLRQLPSQAGWVPVILAAAYVVGRTWRLPVRDHVLLLAWFVTGYVFFSAIDLKEARFTIVLLLPVAVTAFVVAARFGVVACAVLGLGLFGTTLAFAPVPAVKGYDVAAHWVRTALPEGGVVLFSGKRDGSFIFNLRILDPDRRYSIVRADKLLLEIAVRRELGVVEKPLSRDDILAATAKLNIAYVVAERDFWTDLNNMATFQDILDNGPFEEVARLPISANVPHPDKELRIYRDTRPRSATPAELTVDLPIIGQRIKSGSP